MGVVETLNGLVSRGRTLSYCSQQCLGTFLLFLFLFFLTLLSLLLFLFFLFFLFLLLLPFSLLIFLRMDESYVYFFPLSQVIQEVI